MARPVKSKQRCGTTFLRGTRHMWLCELAEKKMKRWIEFLAFFCLSVCLFLFSYFPPSCLFTLRCSGLSSQVLRVGKFQRFHEIKKAKNNNNKKTSVRKTKKAMETFWMSNVPSKVLAGRGRGATLTCSVSREGELFPPVYMYIDILTFFFIDGYFIDCKKNPVIHVSTLRC